jgi:hypothetical protein
VYRELESRTGAAAPQVLRASEDGATVEAAGGDPDLMSADA